MANQGFMINLLSSTQRKFVFYAILLSAHIGLVWLLPHFPTQDGPSHIYNLVILHDLMNGGRDWGDFFSHRLHAVPNFGFNLIAYPLLHFFSPLVVEKLFISIYIALMGISVPLFLRTFGRPTLPLSYFVFPVVFNFNLMMGFYSYVVTVPLFLIAFSLAWRMKDRPFAARFACLNLTGLVLFYFHLVPFILFILCVMVITVCTNRGFRPKMIGLVKQLLFFSPCLLDLAYYLTQGGNNSVADFSYLFSLSRNIDLLNYLFCFSMVTLSPWQMLPASFVIYLYLSLLVIPLYLSVKALYQDQLKFKGVSDAVKTLICMSLLLLLIYIVAPFYIGEGSLFNQRFPWVIFIATLPLLMSPDRICSDKLSSTVIASAVVLLFLFNVVIFRQQSERVELFLSGLKAELPRGSFVMTYMKRKAEWARVNVLLHAVSYYGIHKGVVNIGNYEADSNYSCIIQFRKSLPPFPSQRMIVYKPSMINWSDFPAVQYIFGWEVDDYDRSKLARHFHIIREDGPFILWERTFERVAVIDHSFMIK